MITVFCKCGHEIYQHADGLAVNVPRFHTGRCLARGCECERFVMDRNATKYDTTQYRRKPMMERKDLE